MLELMNDISELVYMCDPETYELLYINSAGKEAFRLGELSGLKCYKALQNRDEPCPFCNMQELRDDQTITWSHTNEVTGRHYLLKDRFIQWHGRKVRIEFAFDLTDSEHEKQVLQNTLHSQQVVMECVRMLYEQSDLAHSIPYVLQHFGSFLQAERCFIFQIEGNTMSNTYEWCGEGIAPQAERLQRMDVSLISSWLPTLQNHECIIVQDIEELRAETPLCYETLHMQNITRMCIAPLEREGRLIGYFGVDNPPAAKLQNIAPLLKTLSYFLMLAYRRSDDKDVLLRMSHTDRLTGLYNRNRYLQDTEQVNGTAQPIGIIYLDLNGLKDLNDQYGHDYGDSVLVECAQTMRASFPQDELYRIGGDEFVILCAGIDQSVFNRRVKTLRANFDALSFCHPAIGCEWSENCVGLSQLIATADDRMYADKKEFYHKNSKSRRYRHQNDDSLSLSDPTELARQIRDNRFVVYVQPKISLTDRSAIGAEALVRYRGSDGKLLQPEEFLPVLERSSLIGQVDFFVFDTVCGRLAQWLRDGKRQLPVSVNFSQVSLAEPQFLERLLQACKRHEVSPELVELEVHSLGDMDDDSPWRTVLENIRAAGFRVSIDDFSIHDVSFPFLSSVNFDVLKLDRRMIEIIVQNSRAKAILKGLVDICRKLDVQVIAEGVETEEQYQALCDFGLEQAQGFLFSRPLPLGEYEENCLQ